MIITTIKLSQEINFNGMPTWIGLEGSLSAGEDEKEGLRSLQKSITDYVKEEQEKLPKPTWMPKTKAEVSDIVKGNLEAINACETQIELDELWILSKSNLILADAWKTKQKQLNDAK